MEYNLKNLDEIWKYYHLIEKILLNGLVYIKILNSLVKNGEKKK